MQNIPILILHGWNLSGEKFSPLRDKLTALGYKVFCPDLPGFGNSKIPDKSLYLSDYVDFVKEYIPKNNLAKVIIVGHSFGGRIAIKFAVQNPKLLQALILSGAPGIVPVARSKALFFIILSKIGKKIFKLPIINLLQNLARKVLYRTAGAMDYYNTNEKMRDTFKNIVIENLELLLPKIKTPTLLLWGSLDGMVPIAIAKKMQKYIKGSKLIEIKNARHGVPWTHPKEFANEVEKFLSKVK